MNDSTLAIHRRELRTDLSASALCGRLRCGQSASLYLDGGGGFEERWLAGGLVAVAPKIVDTSGPLGRALERLDQQVATRRAGPGEARTGVAALLAYEAWEGRPRFPRLVVLEVDASIRVTDEVAELTVRGDPEDYRELEARIDGATARGAPASCIGRPRTSLPRERYLDAVGQVKRHIERGDIYQANLCQQFRVAYRGDRYALYESIAAACPAPQSAFLETGAFALASISPESFLRVRGDDRIETWPIKGTRPRGADPTSDRAAAQALRDSPKDRAELLMIVDLERNDLSRLCLPGTVEVSELASLRSYATVHHLVAGVHGRLRPDVVPSELLRATFPGGSITGAPKVRAMQLLGGLEPVPRDYFTGSLFWFGDDGTLDSSILIRTLVLDGETAYLGAGGGIVADSDPQSEWEESNHKARALARALGFDPEDAA